MLKKEETPIAITKNDLVVLKQDLEQVVKDQVALVLSKELPHECWTCLHFYKVDGNLNKSCNSPEKIQVERGACKMWRLQPDSNKRRRRIY